VEANTLGVLRRTLGNVDLQLQENKAVNLSLAAPHINGVLIRPGETFSFWHLVGRRPPAVDIEMDFQFVVTTTPEYLLSERRTTTDLDAKIPFYRNPRIIPAASITMRTLRDSLMP